jgi:transcriptional regulator with XRE-family HTH domain
MFKKSKGYKSVAELVRDVGGDPAFADDFEKHIAERKLVKRLVALRCARGLSQKDIAAKMGCTQGRISKLEASRDEDLRFGDIRGYAKALGLETILGLEGGPHAVMRVKYYAACIKRQVDRLAGLATNDQAIAEGVSRFFSDAAFNILNILESATKRLPEEVQPLGVSVEIIGPEGEEIEESAVEPKVAVSSRPRRGRGTKASLPA